MGTLGIITEVTLKVVPKPESSITVRRPVGAGESLQVMNAICREPLPLTGACWYAGHVYIRLSGPLSVIGTAARRIEGDILPDDSDFWSRLNEMELPFFADTEDLWCILLRATCGHFEQDGEWLIDWRGAHRWVTACRDRDTLDEHVRDAGGELWQVRGAGQGAEVFPARSEAYRKTLLRLKGALDPAGVFNPGRLYSWM